MGDPRKITKKYKKPKKLLDKTRVVEEGKLKREYGLKNARELWIAQSELRRVRREARKLLAVSEEERKKGAAVVLGKLNRLGILAGDSTIDNVLSLTVRNFLERRLQTLVFRKGMARTPVQARQLITHGYISISGRKVTSPGMSVTRATEGSIAYYKAIDISIPQKEEPKPAEAPAAEKPAEAPLVEEPKKEGESQ